MRPISGTAVAAADGWINIGVANYKFWGILCDVLGRADLRIDPRFQGAPDRVAHRQALRETLESFAGRHGTIGCTI
jgi:crotonobetainyl-CoA:carnitine CoA-transferase CaiB-like acyl-CoA transferase